MAPTFTPGLPTAGNRPGFAHIAFEVDDVKKTLAEVLANVDAASVGLPGLFGALLA